MKRDRLELSVLILAASAFCIGLAFVLMKYILPALLPFIIAFVAALSVRAPAAVLSSKTHISGRVLRPLIAVAGTSALLLSVGIILKSLAEFFAELLVDLTSDGDIYSAFMRLSLPPYLSEMIPDGGGEWLSECIKGVLTSLFEGAASLFARLALSIPDILISFIVTVISVIYFAADIDRICSSLKNLFPEKYKNKISDCERKIIGILGKYVKSYLQIMGITFVIMLIGLMILGVKSPAETALVISALDLLPLLGVGAVLLPWSILAFALGDGALGVGLIVLFLVYTVIREAAEPKIFARSLDVHPIVTLISLYVGYSLFGIFGLVLFPVAAVFLLGLWKKDKSAEVG